MNGEDLLVGIIGVIVFVGLIFGVIFGVKNIKNNINVSNYSRAPVERTVNVVFITPTESELAEKCGKKAKDVRKQVAEVEATISQIPTFKLLDRSKVDLILNEYDFSVSDWADGNTVAEIGRALNAELLLYFEIYDAKTVNISFLNISTMEKFTSKELDIRPAVASLQIPHETVDIEGTWQYDGLMQSQLKYKNSNWEYLSPFSLRFPILPCNNQNFVPNNEDIVKAEIADGEMTLVLASGEKNTSELLYNVKNSVIYNKAKDATEYKPVSAFEAGTVRAKFSSGLSLVNAQVFLKDNRMGILVGTSKEDGTGKAYFMMFSR